MVVVFVEVSPEVRLGDRSTAEALLGKGRDFALKKCGDRPKSIATATAWVLIYQEPFGEKNWKEAFAVEGTLTSPEYGKPFEVRNYRNKVEMAEQQQARERQERERREAAAAAAAREQAERARRLEAQRQAQAAAEAEKARQAELARTAMATCLEQGGRRLGTQQWLSGQALQQFLRAPVSLKGQIVGVSVIEAAGGRISPIADDIVVVDLGGLGLNESLVVSRFPGAVLANLDKALAGKTSKIAGLSKPTLLVAGRVAGLRPIDLPMVGRMPMATLEYTGLAACVP
jgi:hypothetical protein